MGLFLLKWVCLQKITNLSKMCFVTLISTCINLARILSRQHEVVLSWYDFVSVLNFILFYLKFSYF